MKHCLYSADLKSKSAFIVKDPQRAFKDVLGKLDVPTVAKVIGVSKLNANYPSFADKRKLANEFDLFFCDYKIYGNLKKGLGKAFYEKKKYPFPIDCEGKSDAKFEDYLNSLNNYSYFIAGNGPT